MSTRQRLIRLFDRPGGRGALGKVATSIARMRTRADIEIFYQDLWIHRVGSDYFPDGERFNYYWDHFARMPTQMRRYLADAEEYWLRYYRPQPGDTVIDIGAGRGEDIVAFSRAVGRSGRVLAIEAHPVSAAILTHFCRLNDLENTTPLWLAVMDKEGTVSMLESDAWEENAIAKGQPASSIQVPCKTLDQVCAEEAVGEIAFLKMNIEGAEREALLGMTKAIQRISTICVACHDFRAELGHGDYFRTRHIVESLLRSYGFALTSRPNDPRPYVRDHIVGVKK